MLPGSQSMRANYAGGVDKYYAGHASVDYRNPHYIGILKTLSTFMDLYFDKMCSSKPSTTLQVLDMAAGSGEVTEAIFTWHKRRTLKGLPVPTVHVLATDPYTMKAYRDRTGRDCLPLSFSDIAEGHLPEELQAFNLVICSFALHLLTEPSQLWSLLTAIAPRGRHLVVLAPHKKPHIKEEWQWKRVDPWSMQTVGEEGKPSVTGGKRGDGYEIYEERVRLRIWESAILSEDLRMQDDNTKMDSP